LHCLLYFRIFYRSNRFKEIKVEKKMREIIVRITEEGNIEIEQSTGNGHPNVIEVLPQQLEALIDLLMDATREDIDEEIDEEEDADFEQDLEEIDEEEEEEKKPKKPKKTK
jgi:hypothetical protein